MPCAGLKHFFLPHGEQPSHGPENRNRARGHLPPPPLLSSAPPEKPYCFLGKLISTGLPLNFLLDSNSKPLAVSR